MAKSKDDIKYGTAQAKLSEHEALRVRYKHGTPLEGGMIAESETVDLFSSADNIAKAGQAAGGENEGAPSAKQSQSHRPSGDDEGEADTGHGGRGMSIPKNKTPSVAPQV